MLVLIFSVKVGVFGGVVSRRFPEKNPRKGGGFCFYILPVVINTRDMGVYPFPEIGGGGGQVMGNEHRYPLMLWELWGGLACIDYEV